MGERSAKSVLIAAAVWVVILGILAVAAKILVLPYFQKSLEHETGSDSRYKHEVVLAADTFSGYCVFRSAAMKNDLKQQGIKLTIQDDGADYEGRMKALLARKIPLAVFTVDSFITAGARLNKFPASIVMVVDETRGADAMVSYKAAVARIQDLDDPAARIMLTPNSPSEFLARTVIAHFNLPSLPEQWRIKADGAQDVYKKFLAANKTDKRAYVLWEPYVSKALETEGAQLLLDSSKLKGYIVDVLVAERSFLSEQPGLVRAVVESYLRSAHAYSQKSGGMASLVKEDAEATGSEKLSGNMAERLVQGIEWKNTLENYAYFGLLSPQDSKGSQHIEDVISNITNVLIKTGALSADPLEGKAHRIFYDRILKDMQAAQFHPGKKVDVVQGLGLGTADLEGVRHRGELRPLSDEEWNALIPVGRMRVQPISFARGAARIHIQSERELDDLVRNLHAWPQYYLIVEGHARAEGEREANLKLAEERSRAVSDYILAKGISPNRIRTKSAPPSDKGGSAQSVTFELVQVPY